ncbi:acid protease [Peniophora sp. CONT]|nr:acid protease [Peniophora sp. CONT]
MLLPLLCLPALVAGLPGLATRQDNIHHLPLVRRTIRRSDGFVELDRLAMYADAVRYKHGFKTVNQLERRASAAGISMIDLGRDTGYLATINFGTPPQPLDVLLDTGSADLWVATTACQACPNNSPKFNMAQSSTLVATSQAFTFSYADHSSASGNLVQDTVAIGPYTVHSQSFAGVTSISGIVANLGSNAGILGLAFQNIAVSGASPLWETLIAAGELSSPEMSFYIKRYASIATSPTQLDPGGTFTLGGTNSSFFKGDIEFNAFPPHVIPSAWMQLVSGMTVNGQQVDLANVPNNYAIIDTGTSLLGGPAAAVEAFWTQIDGAFALGGTNLGYWIYPCATEIDVTLAFGGTAWPISSGDMNSGQYGPVPGYCVGSFFDITFGNAPDPDSASWIIGDTFLKNVYTVLRAGDNPAIGFAQLADGLNV